MQYVILAILTIFILGILLKKAHKTLVDDRVYVTAFDNRKYKVRNTENKNETAEALARLNQKVETLINKLVKDSNNEYEAMAKRLAKRYNPSSISEGRIDKRYTSYTVNKGEEISLCMRTRDSKDSIYEDNIIFYVTLHELAHISSVTENHNDEFHRNFRYLLQKAAEYNMFQKRIEKFNYCGLDVESM